MKALRRLFTLLVLISAVFGSLGLGAEFAEAIPALSGDICTDDCADAADDEAAGCDGMCICACCPPPAVPPAFSLNLGTTSWSASFPLPWLFAPAPRSPPPTTLRSSLRPGSVTRVLPIRPRARFARVRDVASHAALCLF